MTLDEYQVHPVLTTPYRPNAWTTGPLTYDPYVLCTTSAEMPSIKVENPIARAMEYIKETRKEIKLIFHLVSCNYCRSNYPANLEISYECPACGAYDFEIERSINDELVIQRT
jgi:hypothetical protein